MSISIRKATLEDAEDIAKIHVSSWQTTYKGIMDADFLKQLSVRKRTELWVKNIQHEGDIVLLASINGKLIGFACGSHVKEGEYEEYDGDVTSIYFHQDVQGQGFGKLLMIRLFEEFIERGYQTAIVKVLEKNKACLFYEALGAKLIDTQIIPIPGGEATLLTYAWDNIQRFGNETSYEKK